MLNKFQRICVGVGGYDASIFPYAGSARRRMLCIVPVICYICCFWSTRTHAERTRTRIDHKHEKLKSSIWLQMVYGSCDPCAAIGLSVKDAMSDAVDCYFCCCCCSFISQHFHLKCILIHSASHWICDKLFWNWLKIFFVTNTRSHIKSNLIVATYEKSFLHTNC